MYAAADPMTRLPLGVPQLVVVGEDDDLDLLDFNRRYAARARATGDDVTYVERPGDHFAVIDPASEIWTATMSRGGQGDRRHGRGMTGSRAGRLAVRPSPVERPRIRRSAHGPRKAAAQRTSAPVRSRAFGRRSGGSSPAQVRSLPGRSRAWAAAAAMRSWPRARRGDGRGSTAAASVETG